MPDTTLEFLNKVTPRIGPANAINLLKDAHLTAFRQLFVEAGVSEKRVQEIIDGALQKTAQNILEMPVPSPFVR